jgi:uridine kinase
MINYNQEIIKGKEKELVDYWENRFLHSIELAVQDISQNKAVQFVSITGPTCSGKTTTASLLVKLFEKNGIESIVLSVDDFYDITANDIAMVNFESIDAIDVKCFEKCINDIADKKTAQVPIFDFVTQTRAGYKELPYKDNRIIIIEGIQTMYPEIRNLLPSNNTKRIFIDVEKINAYGVVFDCQYVRLCRRLVRDYQFRNSSAKRTLNMWNIVTSNENKNIYPYFDLADYKISSLMPYGLNVIKNYLFDLIKYDLSDSVEEAFYNRIKQDFSNIPPMSSQFVPNDSVFREFIGQN